MWTPQHIHFVGFIYGNIICVCQGELPHLYLSRLSKKKTTTTIYYSATRPWHTRPYRLFTLNLKFKYIFFYFFYFFLISTGNQPQQSSHYQTNIRIGCSRNYRSCQITAANRWRRRGRQPQRFATEESRNRWLGIVIRRKRRLSRFEIHWRTNGSRGQSHHWKTKIWL